MKCMWHIMLGWSVSYLYRTSFGRFGRVIKKQQSQQIPIIWRKGCRLVYSSPSSCPQAPTKESVLRDSKCVKNALHNCFEASDTYQHTVLSRAHKEDIISFLTYEQLGYWTTRVKRWQLTLFQSGRRLEKLKTEKNRSNFKEQFCRPPLLH